ncbi:MAG: sugar transferase [Chloroflexi bacterium]|nr:sugar transferase [Chloroflexota bacterium]
MEKLANNHPDPGWRIRPREAFTLLLLGDLFAGIAALLPALYIWGTGDEWLGEFSLDFLQARVPLWFYLLPLLWVMMLFEIYDTNHARDWRKTLQGIAIATLAGALIYAVIYLISPKGSLPRTGVGVFLACAASLTTAWRIVYIRIFTAPAFTRRVLIVGAGVSGNSLAEVYKGLRPPPFHLVGFIDDDPSKIGSLLAGFPVIAGSNKLLETAASEKISDLVIAIGGELRGETFQTILDARERGVEVTPMPSMYEELLGRVPIHHLESDWIIRSFVMEARVNRFYEVAKRLMDILGALLGLVLMVLSFPLIALVILVDSGRPIFYTQVRSGKGARLYDILKFRTMRQDAEADGKARVTQKKDERITRAGSFLRRTHLDELPQFWNVLRGEMSLVGPRAERPELITEYERQIPFYRARLLVKPGITGLAQIKYSYFSTVEETSMKLEYDLYYIKHRNLGLDLVILLRTVGQVIGLKGR